MTAMSSLPSQFLQTFFSFGYRFAFNWICPKDPLLSSFTRGVCFLCSPCLPVRLSERATESGKEVKEGKRWELNILNLLLSTDSGNKLPSQNRMKEG